MTYRSKDFVDETNSRKRAMEALQKTRPDTTPKTQENKSFINKLWSYVNRHQKT